MTRFRVVTTRWLVLHVERPARRPLDCWIFAAAVAEFQRIGPRILDEREDRERAEEERRIHLSVVDATRPRQPATPVRRIDRPDRGLRDRAHRPLSSHAHPDPAEACTT